MNVADALDSWTRGPRGPAIAALIAVLAALPGWWSMPVLDRDEARFAQASAQMLETRDFTTINFQDQPRFKKPVGIYWMQAAVTAVVSNAEARDIRTYRIPSLLGAALAAAACAWGAAAFLRPGLAFLAGALFASTVLLSTEGFIAKTDAMLCGLVTLAMAALGRLYLAHRGTGPPAGWRTYCLFWLSVALAILVKGPVGPMVVALSLVALALWDREGRWILRLRWDWGLIIILAICGPWALAITVTTDGGFWGTAIGGDLAPKLVGGQESHGAPPGYYTLLSPVLMFPACLLIPAAAVLSWQGRNEPHIRFAICWLIPTWLVFELIPTKLVHYTLPAYGGAIWLMAAALARPIGPRVRLAGLIVIGLGALVLAGLVVYVATQHGGADSMPAAITALIVLAAAAAAAVGFMRQARWSLPATVSVGFLGILAHGLIVGSLAPSLRPLWLSERSSTAVRTLGLDPREDVVAGPIAVAGYAEPSLVFLLGTPTELTDAAGAARALEAGRPALIEAGLVSAVRALHPDLRPAAANVRGLNYSNGRQLTLYLYAPASQVTPRTPATDAQRPVEGR